MIHTLILQQRVTHQVPQLPNHPFQMVISLPGGGYWNACQSSTRIQEREEAEGVRLQSTGYQCFSQILQTISSNVGAGALQEVCVDPVLADNLQLMRCTCSWHLALSAGRALHLHVG